MVQGSGLPVTRHRLQLRGCLSSKPQSPIVIRIVTSTLIVTLIATLIVTQNLKPEFYLFEQGHAWGGRFFTIGV